MKKLITLLVLSSLFFSQSALAYDGITFYGAMLSFNDRVNSSGTRLKSVRDFLQQDRANYYKFNLRDAQDQPDGFFTTVDKRLLFQKMQIRIDPQLEKKILNGYVNVIGVYVYDESSLEVLEGLPNPNAD